LAKFTNTKKPSTIADAKNFTPFFILFFSSLLETFLFPPN